MNKLKTGKQVAQEECRQQLAAIEQLFQTIEGLPDDFPAPTAQSPILGGYISFTASRANVRKITGHFGREDWRRGFQGKRGSSIVVEWQKVLPNGIRVTIENAEVVPDTVLIFGQSVDPMALESESEMFIGS